MNRTFEAPDSGRIFSAIDGLHGTTLHGWIARSGSNPAPNQGPVPAALYEGAVRIADLDASNFRSEIREAALGDGFCGFATPLPLSLFDGKIHAFQVRVGAQVVASAELLLPPQRGAEGNFDRIEGLLALGWAQDPEAPGERLPVELLVGDRMVATGLAKHFRKDLEEAGLADPWCAYRIRIPDAYLNGMAHPFMVREGRTGRVFPLSAPVPLAVSWRTVRLTGLRDALLTIEADKRPAQDARLAIDLWIDDTRVDRFTIGEDGVPAVTVERGIPARYLDGSEHRFTLTLAESGFLLDSLTFRTDAVAFTPDLLLLDGAVPDEELANDRFAIPMVAGLIDRILRSRLFDSEVFAAATGLRFPSKRDAVHHYLGNRNAWLLPTSVWLDPRFVADLSGGLVPDRVSPLEWYLRQGRGADAGPNPLFSNADFRLLSGRSDGMADSMDESVSCFDDWLDRASAEGEADSSLSMPSFFVDVEHIRAGMRSADSPSDGGRSSVVGFLADWLATPPDRRRLDVLHPYFDEDWLAQRSLLGGKRTEGCRLAAFRLGRFPGGAPHPLMQDEGEDRNYYDAIRRYEILHRLTGEDAVELVSGLIDPGAFLAVFPATAEPSSALYRCVTADAGIVRRSFLTTVDDGFIAAEYPGLIDFAARETGVADINRIWARWLRTIRCPATYADALAGEKGFPSITEMRTLRNVRACPAEEAEASFIIPSYGRDDLVLRCVLSAILHPGADRLEFVVAEDAAHIDGGGILGYFLPFARFIRNPANLGFLANCNNAAAQTAAAVLIFVNNDIIVHKDAIPALLSTFRDRPRAGVVGGLILNPDGTIQENGGLLWADGSAWNYHRGRTLGEESVRNLRETDYVSGCWMGIRRTVWEEIGGFDTRFAPAYCEDSDFCLASRDRGHAVLVNPHSVVTHLEGATMGTDENSSSLKSHQRTNSRTLARKWALTLGTQHQVNGDATPFHTGRRFPRKSIALVFENNIPEFDQDAGSRTLYAVCRTLAAMENTYVVFVPQNNHRSRYAQSLERLGIEVISGSGSKRFEQLVERHSADFSYAFVSRIPVARHFKRHLERLRCVKSLYPVDVEALRAFPHDTGHPGFAPAVDAAMERYADQNRDVVSLFDNIVSCSEDETRLLRQWFTTPVVDMFPYDFPTASPPTAESARRDILFVGSYNHHPNREGIAYFVSRIWPQVTAALPEATLHICGSGFDHVDFSAVPNAIRHGLVSDGTLNYLYSICRVSIAPLLTGAGIKGKVIEASANGVPCVGTEAAWQGLAVPLAYGDLTGPIETFGERLIRTYRAYGPDMVASLLAFHMDSGRETAIAEVIPRLAGMKSRRRPSV
ncbi:glycosyltransferase [Azospirillum doebereinerae]|uniref:Glycosyltransferase n=1 Tax=Azospirillum doebereinerae TaxID=92933 RepID=A0A3S0V3F6_9PROT|nr:glycosyltransferase [Azospirillum doebereinerae]RUQ75198.1 glycosyltransferase [Azospirillum doebereinerae]